MEAILGIICGFFLWLAIGLIAYYKKNDENGQN